MAWSLKRFAVTALACIWSIPEGKAILIQVWTGLEGSRRFRLPDFKTVGG
jgi:hypothetical protein